MKNVPDSSGDSLRQKLLGNCSEIVPAETSKNVADSLKKTNDSLNQEVLQLRGQVESLSHRCEIQETELNKSRKQAADESAKCKAAKDVINSLTGQVESLRNRCEIQETELEKSRKQPQEATLKDMAERLPPGSYDMENIKLPNCLEPNSILHNSETNGESQPNSNPVNTDTSSNGNGGYSDAARSGVEMGNKYFSDHVGSQDGENNGFKTVVSGSNNNDNDYNAPGQVEAEWVEQYEPGVYVTLVDLRDGTRDLKRVRFSRRRFEKHQAETWWFENREKVYDRYNVCWPKKSSQTAAHGSSESLASPAR